MKNKSAIELGDLVPLRDARGKVADWIIDDKVRRPENDPVVHALERVLNWIDKGLADAANAEMELTTKQRAEALGITPEALYKREQRAKQRESAAAGRNKNEKTRETDEKEKAA